MGATLCLLFAVCPGGRAGGASTLSAADQTTLDRARGMHAEAQTLLNTGRPDESIELLLDARELLSAADHRPFVNRSAKLAVWLGVVYATVGDVGEAEAWYETGLREATSQHHDKTMADALIGLADLRSKADDFGGALALLAQAGGHAELVADRIRLGKIRFLQGEARQRHGDLAGALDAYFDAAEALVETVRSGADERREAAVPDHERGASEEVRYYAMARAGTGEVLARLGYPTLGATELLAVLEHPESFHPQDGTRLLAIGAVLQAEAGDLAAARDLAEQADASFELHGPDGEEGIVRAAAAIVDWYDEDGPAGACDRLAAASEIAADRGQEADRRDLVRRLSACRLDDGDLQGAFAAAGWAKQLADAAQPSDLWRAWWALARARRALDRPDAGYAYLQALDGLDEQIRELRLDALALGLEGSARGIYDETADVLLAQGRAEAALTVLERG